ncbi:MAG TPA: hypothetical protein VFK38_11210 [Candidatus Limnocylindrales bacterium]|nr:hypothetical protein [Candidatus Limnocylindrales bacterium]
MSISLQAYTEAGLLQAELAQQGHLGELLETVAELPVDGRLGAFAGGPAERVSGVLEVDDMLLVAAPLDTPAPVHAAWHRLRLAVGPYEVEGELATMPGFDPGRALARPGGTFVLLAQVRVALGGDGPIAEHAFAWVNRYAVERVTADIDLAHYFPGAEGTVSRE